MVRLTGTWEKMEALNALGTMLIEADMACRRSRGDNTHQKIRLDLLLGEASRHGRAMMLGGRGALNRSHGGCLSL